MSRLLLASVCVGALALAAPANAQPFSGSSGVRVQIGSGSGPHHGDPGSNGDRRRGQLLVYGYGSPEGWAYYNNRSFAPDSFNDWWHDRPDRSIPRWVGQNGSCERQYWTGAGWRC